MKPADFPSKVKIPSNVRIPAGLQLPENVVHSPNDFGFVFLDPYKRQAGKVDTPYISRVWAEAEDNEGDYYSLYMMTDFRGEHGLPGYNKIRWGVHSSNVLEEMLTNLINPNQLAFRQPSKEILRR